MNNLLKNIFTTFLEDENNYISTPGGTFTVKNFILLNRILNGDKGYYVVFNNGVGKAFDLFELKSEEELNLFLPHIAGYIYGYRRFDIDVVIKNIK